MKESIVQWTLLNNLDFLSKSLDFPIYIKKGQEISTDFGRIDFIVQNNSGEDLIVELETTLNSSAKLEYCFNQILNYKNVSFSPNTQYCILYADETHKRNRDKIKSFAQKHSIIEKSYSIESIKQLYSETVERLSLSFGLSMPQPANYTICYLRWLNKILKPYKDFNKNNLSKKEISKYFSSFDSTNFKCYLRLALDFEMISVEEGTFKITHYGLNYIENFNPDIELNQNLSSVNLTNEQKKILLGVTTNGNWTNHKVNIYWFLRFLEITKGNWLPKSKTFDPSLLAIANGLFDVSYKSRTMYEFLNFACNWCKELELIDIIKTNTAYDKVFLTPLGIELNNIFALDLQLKKTRLNLNFKYLD